MDRRYVMSGLGYALAGLALGIYMAASNHHAQLATHAHIMLVGFVISFVYGVIHKVWLTEAANSLYQPQFWCHQVGTAAMVVGLFCLKGGYLPEAVLGPLLGISSLLILAGAVLMKVLFIKQVKRT